MKNFDELRDIAQKYINKKKKTEIILFDPIFRIEKDKLCLMHALVEFKDEASNDFRIKRPTEWFIQDIITGEILDYYNIENYDFANVNILPLDSLFENTGKSIVYDYNNYVVDSFRKWKENIKKELEIKINNTKYKLDREKVMQVNEKIISPRDYVLANLDDSLEKMHDILFYDLGDAIRDAYNLYYENLFENIRQKYIEENIIDQDLIKKYLNLIKYLWPESHELINKMTNIDNVIDEDFDQEIKEMLEKKLQLI